MGVVEGCCGDPGREAGADGPAGGHAHEPRTCSLTARRLFVCAVVLVL